MQDLPYDIWGLIASYLPVDEVKTLYSVNRSLFNISLDLRYPEVCLNTHPGEFAKAHDIRLFRNPLLAPRPKTFRIHFCPGVRKRVKAKSRLKNLRLPFVRSDNRLALSPPIAELVEVVQDVVPRLTGVTKLKVDSSGTLACECTQLSDGGGGGGLDQSEDEHLVMPTIWKALGDQIRSLSIDAAVEDLEILFSGWTQMPHLATLSLAVFPVPIEFDVDGTVARVLVPILTEHRSTLRNVAFQIDNHDYSAVLLCLARMRRLQDIKFYLPAKATPFAGYHVLAAHQAHLRSFTLHHLPDPEQRFAGAAAADDSPSFFSQDWCSVELPHLAELTVLMPKKMTFRPEFADYVHRFASSLVSLAIVDHPDFKHEDLREFGSRLREFHSLRSLALSIHGLSPANLALLASALPHLESLSISYHYICPCKDDQHFNPSHLAEFYDTQLRPHAPLFANWELERLDFTPAQNWSIVFGPDGSRKIDQRTRIMAPLLHRLPNVKWFCKLPREALSGGSLYSLDGNRDANDVVVV